MRASLLSQSLTIPVLIQLCLEPTHLFSLLSKKVKKHVRSFSVLSFQRPQDAFLHSFGDLGSFRSDQPELQPIINIDKTKVMTSDGVPCHILIHNEQLEQMNTFPCLGSLITEDGEYTNSAQDYKQSAGNWGITAESVVVSISLHIA